MKTNYLLIFKYLTLFVDHFTRFVSEEYPTVWDEFSEKYPEDIDNFVKIGYMIKK